MAIVAADLVARVTADTASAVRGIAGFGQSLLSMGAQVGVAALGIGALGVGLAALTPAFLGPAAQMETFQTQLTTLMGSAEAAKNRLAELAKFGAETPFELPELVQAEKVLQGFGLTGQKALDMTGRSGQELFSILGDIAAGTGVAFNEIALNFGKFSAGATGEAISRFQELGIATREQMAQLGIQFSKSGELLSPLPEAMQAVLQIAGGKFEGGMAALSNTFEGRMSTLQDAWGSLMRTLGTPLLGVVGPGLVWLSNFLGGPVTEAAQGVMERFGEFGQSIAPAVQIASDAFKTFQAAMAGDWTANANTIFPLVNSIGVLGTSIRNDVIPALSELGEWIMSAFGGSTGDQMTSFAADVLPRIGQGFQSVIEQAGPFAALLISSIRPAIETVSEFVTSTLIPGLQQIATVVGPYVLPAVQHMSEAFANMGAQVEPIMAELAPLGAAFVELGQALAPIAALVGGVMVAGFVMAWETLSGLLMGVPTVVKGVVQGVTAVVSGLADVIGGMVGIVTGILAGDWAAAWNSAGQVVSGAWAVIEGIATAGAGIVLGIIGGFVSAALNYMAQMVPGARDELMKFKAMWIESIQSIDVGAMIREQMNNMIRGITDSIPGIADALGKLRGLFPSSPAERGPWSELPEWSAAFSSLPSALSEAYQNMLTGLEPLHQAVTDAVGGMSGQVGITATSGALSADMAHALAVQSAETARAAASAATPQAVAAANSAATATLPPIQVTNTFDIHDNTFGYGPDGLMRPEDWERFAEMLAPKVSFYIARDLAEAQKAKE